MLIPGNIRAKAADPSPPKSLNGIKDGLGITSKLENFVPTCETVSINATAIFPELISRGAFDEVDLMLAEWGQHCDPAKNEIQLRSRLLASYLKDGVIYFEETDLELFLSYQQEYGKRKPPVYEDAQSQFDVFDRFTYELAQNALADAKLKRNPIMYYYAHEFDEFHTQIRKDQASSLGRAMANYRNEIKEIGTLPLGIYTGIWQPAGAANILGIHPVLGFFAGVAKYKMEAIINIQFRFADSAENRFTVHQGQQIQNNYFFGGSILGELTYNLFTERSFDLGITVGLGYDGLDIVKSANSSAKDGKSLGSVAATLGPTYRYYWGVERQGYVFVTARISPILYNNAGGSDLTGIGLTVYCGIGAALSPERANRLRTIGGL